MGEKGTVDNQRINRSLRTIPKLKMIEHQYLDSVLKRFMEYKTLGEKAMLQLKDEDLQWMPNSESNSIALIIQHMHGNMMSRWTNFLTEDGEKEWRQRDLEFEDQQLTRKALMDRWEAGWKVVFTTIGSLQPNDLNKTVTIRSQPLIVIDAINRQFAHYSYHIGQIVYISKMIKELAWKSLSIPRRVAVSDSSDNHARFSEEVSDESLTGDSSGKVTQK
jgi:hypothetical protein